MMILIIIIIQMMIFKRTIDNQNIDSEEEDERGFNGAYFDQMGSTSYHHITSSMEVHREPHLLP